MIHKEKADELIKIFGDAKAGFNCVDCIIKALEELNNKGLPPDGKLLNDVANIFEYWEGVKSELSYYIIKNEKHEGKIF